MKKKTAVILINVGTPDEPTVKAVRRYLSEFLNDRRVIDIPLVLQKILVNLIIVPFRAPKSTKLYQRLWTEKGSPLLYFSEQVQTGLQKSLGGRADVFMAMRYGNPSMGKTLAAIQKGNYDRLVIFPMKIPENAPKAIYKNEFIYKNLKTGEEKEFGEADIPWKDTLNWKFVKAKDPVVVQKGYTPPIHDFRIETPEGEDIKDFFLYDEKYTFIAIASNLQKTNKEGMKKIAALAVAAKAKGYNFIALTASSPDSFEAFKNETGANFDFFNTDEIVLKTIVRSNPGLIVLKKGTILKKYHFNDIPKPEELDSQFE